MMERAYQICGKYKMHGSIDRNAQTHNKGGHLDQIFTNIEGLAATIEDT